MLPLTWLPFPRNGGTLPMRREYPLLGWEVPHPGDEVSSSEVGGDGTSCSDRRGEIPREGDISHEKVPFDLCSCYWISTSNVRQS
jgi:hypothetical protein